MHASTPVFHNPPRTDSGTGLFDAEQLPRWR
jgi:hypothetical protein